MKQLKITMYGIFFVLLCVLMFIEHRRENHRVLSPDDTSAKRPICEGQIPDEDFLAAEVRNAICDRCDGTVQQLDSYSMKLYENRKKLYEEPKAIKVQKSNGANANQLNDRSPTLLQKPPDTVFITTVKVRYIHDTIYLKEPVSNNPTYLTK